MKKCRYIIYKFPLFLILMLSLSFALPSQNNANIQSSNLNTKIWKDVNEETINADPKKRHIKPSLYRTVAIDIIQLKSVLKQASLETERNNKVIITLPNPDNTFTQYFVFKNTTMHPTLQANFPEIRTYDAVSLDASGKTAKIDLTLQGFHAMIFTPEGDQIFIDPYIVGNTDNYQVYYKKNYERDNEFHCNFDQSSVNKKLDQGTAVKAFGSCELRTYRLALACTQEYAAVFGGTQAGALSAQVTTMNRVNGIYEKELAVTMEIIGNNNLIVYTGADPYSNNDPRSLLRENQLNIDNVIGTANYDIGHVFGTRGGGLANKEVVCKKGSQARGATGLRNPRGDLFDVNYVCHEMGHQFGATHTQNNDCQRTNSSAMEPGSGSTIMSYAGICAPNIQNRGDEFFHSVTLEQMGGFITSTGHTCPVKTNLNNTPPSITGSSGNTVIPKSTPFALTMNVNDPDANNVLTFTWEQMNSESSVQPPSSSSTLGPNFRSILPSVSPTRYFPNLSDLSQNMPTPWEVLPSVSRTMNFRGVVRDNASGGACNEHVDITVRIDANAGPFVVTYPSATGIKWNGSSSQTITWNEAGTSGGDVSCSNVDIYLSTDGGLTYPDLIASQVTNNGSATFKIPNVSSTNCRIMVKCADGTFFNISENDFEILMTTSVHSISQEKAITFYPNPVTNTLNISGVSTIKNLKLLDATGKIVYNINSPNSSILSINLKDFSQGLYFLLIDNTEKLESFKVIKR